MLGPAGDSPKADAKQSCSVSECLFPHVSNEDNYVHWVGWW